jgi:hypothetical protein
MLGGTTYCNTINISGIDCVLGKGEGSGDKRVGASWPVTQLHLERIINLEKCFNEKKEKVEEFNCQLGKVGDAMALLDH